MSISKAKLTEKRQAGRPRIYSAEKIAEELLEWVKDEDAINLAQFCADKGYLPDLIWRFDKENEEFSYAYMIAKMRLAERRERFLNAEILNYGSFQRYQSQYDPFLKKSETEEKDEDAIRRKGIVESEHANLITLASLAANGKIRQKD
jgi:hypothetical protein